MVAPKFLGGGAEVVPGASPVRELLRFLREHRLGPIGPELLLDAALYFLIGRSRREASRP